MTLRLAFLGAGLIEGSTRAPLPSRVAARLGRDDIQVLNADVRSRRLRLADPRRVQGPHVGNGQGRSVCQARGVKRGDGRVSRGASAVSGSSLRSPLRQAGPDARRVLPEPTCSHGSKRRRDLGEQSQRLKSSLPQRRATGPLAFRSGRCSKPASARFARWTPWGARLGSELV